MLFDLHLHSHFSDDAINDPKKLARFYWKKGMGFAITDHNNCDAWPAITKYARHYGVEHVLGEEIKVFGNGKYLGEFLGYFMNAPVKQGDYRDVLDQLGEQDAIVSVAHPFDALRRPIISKPMFKDPKRAAYILKRIHAIECCNSRSIFSSFNKKAVGFAEKNSLALTGGSDAHFPEELGKAYTLIAGTTSEELRQEIKKGKTRCGGKASSPLVHVLTLFAKHTNKLDDF